MNTKLRSIILLFVYLGTGNAYTKAFNYEESLKQLKSKVGNECYKGVAASERNVRDFIVQATLAWNAKTPGLINGTHDYLSDYEGCLAISHGTNKPLTQYCLFTVDVAYLNGPGIQACTHGTWRFGSKPCLNKLKWALCAPSTCSNSEMLAMAELLVHESDIGQAGLSFNVSLPDYECQTAAKTPFSTHAIAFFSLIGIIAAIVAYCTFRHFSLCCKQGGEAGVQVPPRILNWSLLHNWSGLMVSPKGEIRAFHSLRFICVCVTIFIHRNSLYMMGPLANFEDAAEYMELSNFMRVEFAVDSFFSIGGFVLMRNFLQSSNRKPLEMIFARYFRLMPVYALMVFYASSVLEYTGSGPFWPEIVHIERDSCRTSWWLSLLMVANYGQLDQLCWPPAWYMAGDFHFFIIGVAVCCLTKKSRALGLLVIHLIIVASVVIFSAVILQTHSPVLLSHFNGEVRSVRFMEYVGKVYIKSHLRFGCYFIGMLAGYYSVKFAEPGSTVTQKTVEKWYKLSYVLMASMLFSGSIFFWVSNRLALALYGAMVRQIFCAGVCLFVLAATFGKIPNVSNFLDSKIWVPLSKITYGMYCLHVAKQIVSIGAQLHPLQFDYSVTIVPYFTDIIFAALGGLVLYLCVEVPCSGLISMLLKDIRKRKEKSS